MKNKIMKNVVAVVIVVAGVILGLAVNDAFSVSERIASLKN